MNKFMTAVLGGNGFVGQRVLEQLHARNMPARCISRTGSKPTHMQGDLYQWSEEIDWFKGDGEQLEPEALAGCSALICLVGAPPIPRLTAQGIAEQRHKNSTANCRAIELAKHLGIKRLAVLGAHLSAPARSEKFGYFLGKQDCLRAARQFAETDGCQATVVQPFLITGRRYLTNGKAVPLDMFPGKLAAISMDYVKPVESVANALVSAIRTERPGFRIVGKSDF